MVGTSRRASAAHARGARSDSAKLEAERAAGMRWMVAAAVLCALGAMATALVIRQPQLEGVFVAGWIMVAVGAVLFVRGFWQFVRT